METSIEVDDTQAVPDLAGGTTVSREQPMLTWLSVVSPPCSAACHVPVKKRARPAQPKAVS
jgi:hypothetical protein